MNTSKAQSAHNDPILDIHCPDYFNNQSDDVVLTTITNYTPKMARQLWRETGSFTRDAIADFAPQHEREAQLMLTAVARLVGWSYDTAAHELDREVIFSGANIEAYIAQAMGATGQYSRATVRRRLMRVAEELGTVDRRRISSRPGHRPEPHKPYSSRELAALRAMGHSRSTQRRRHNWTVFMCLAGGMALSAAEIGSVKREDLSDSAAGVRFTSPNRDVTCTLAFEDDLRDALNSTLGADYLFAVDAERRPDGSYVGAAIQAAAGLEPAPLASRLRATWIVNQLNSNVHTATVIHALGIASLRPLETYMRYVARPDATAGSAQLRKAVSA